MFNILYGFLKNFQKKKDFMVIFIRSKTIFFYFAAQNHETSKIRYSHLVELVILHFTCVLYAFPFNSLPLWARKQ